jgi:hypothetical protein
VVKLDVGVGVKLGITVGVKVLIRVADGTGDGVLLAEIETVGVAGTCLETAIESQADKNIMNKIIKTMTFDFICFQPSTDLRWCSGVGDL